MVALIQLLVYVRMFVLTAATRLCALMQVALIQLLVLARMAALM